jgi:hypothetical protein
MSTGRGTGNRSDPGTDCVRLGGRSRERFGIGTPLGQASVEEIFSLLTGGALIQLDNGWRLTTARIAGDEVTELILSGVVANRSELLGYGFNEEIIHYKRRWFAGNEIVKDVLARLVRRHRPIRDMSS